MRHTVRNILFAILLAGVLVACQTAAPGTGAELTVTVAGTGTGTVTASPGSIDTGAIPPVTSGNFPLGTEVTITATPAAGSTFSGFSFPVGATYACEDADPADAICVITMDGARSVTATFTAAAGSATLNVGVATGGTAAGTVSSSPAGITDCADDCSAVFDVGATVTLTASVTAGAFAGWTGGDCDGVKALGCQVTISAGEPGVTANFNDVVEETFVATSATNIGEEFLGPSGDGTLFPTGYSYTSSEDVELGRDPAHNAQLVGMRFVNVSIPADAAVESAILTFTAWVGNGTLSTGSGDPVLVIRGEATANPLAFVQNTAGLPTFDISSRPSTAATAEWSITDAWTDGETYDSVDLAGVVEEIVALGAWATGNPLIVIVGPQDNASTAFRRAEKSVVLTVRYVPLP